MESPQSQLSVRSMSAGSWPTCVVAALSHWLGANYGKCGSGANAGWVSEHSCGDCLLIMPPLVEIWEAYFHDHHIDLLDNV